MTPEARKRKNAKKDARIKARCAVDPEFRERMVAKWRDRKLRKKLEKDPNYLVKRAQKEEIKQKALRELGLDGNKELTADDKRLLNNAIQRLKWAAQPPDKKKDRIKRMKDYWGSLSDDERKAKTRQYVGNYRRKKNS